MAPSRISESTKVDDTAFIPPFGLGQPHAMSTPGRHSRIDDPEGEKHVGRHRSPDQRPPLLKMTGGIALAFSIFGIVVGWLMFGLPSIVGIWTGLRVLKREGTPQPLAVWAFYLGIIGLFMGVLTVVAVITQ